MAGGFLPLENTLKAKGPIIGTCDIWDTDYNTDNLRTWIHDNLCYLTINCNTGQHSQFLQCFLWQHFQQEQEKELISFFSEWVSNFWKQQLKGTEVSVVRSRLFCIYCSLSCEKKKEAFWTMYLQSGSVFVFLFKIIDFANMLLSKKEKMIISLITITRWVELGWLSLPLITPWKW